MTSNAIVEFIPPKITFDSVNVQLKEDNIIEITSTYTIWADDVDDQAMFYYTIGDTYFSRDGIEISCDPGQHVFADILTLKIYDLYINKVEIDILDMNRTINLNDYVKIDDDKEDEYPDVSIWIML